ncbi:hypothetical protein [Micromonospora sp. URMC 103]|uniref:hypothetical protein n=1 Tax=Micromonospora sp. URMC 103 TaxID=3423406 RepID=UPI003F1B5B98
MTLPRLDSAGFVVIRAALGPTIHLRIAIRMLGGSAERMPAHGGGSWLEQIAWGVDSVMATARLAYVGQLLGAGMVIRQQLERWTENLAYNSGTFHRPGEDRADFIERVWSVAPKQSWRMPAETPNGRYPAFVSTRSPGRVFSDLSEFLHGRLYREAVAWDAVELLAPGRMGDSEVRSAYRLIAEGMALVVERLRACVGTYAVESGRAEMESMVWQLPNATPAGSKPPPSQMLYPLTPQTGLNPVVVADSLAVHSVFERILKGERPAGRVYRDDEMLDICFLEFRARAIAGALRAFSQEKEKVGRLDFDYLLFRENHYILSSEIAALASRWEQGEIADGLAISASALRSGFWLWLEDDDRAMSMLRTVLEQVARVRTWRTKPEKARRLEASPATMPRDWLEAAGLRRLAALNRALGEMAHLRADGSWSGARDLLAELQHPESRIEDYLHTGRGHALSWMSLILAKEAVAVIGRHSAVLARSMGEIVSWFDVDEPGRDREYQRFLDFAWTLRRADIIKKDRSGPAFRRAQLRKLFGEPPVPFRPAVLIGDPEVGM